MFRRVYLDNSATTPIDPMVLEAMIPFLKEDFGNASSIHYFGQRTRAAVDKARHQVAGLINSRPNEIVFTSGGTESNNLAIRGLIEARASESKSHVVASTIEHPAIKNVIEDLEKNGRCEVTWLPVYENGVVRLNDVNNAVRGNTVLISVMAANNEIGTIQPIVEIGGFVRELRASGRKLWFHTDAVQAVGKTKVDVEEIGCDLLSLSAHKIYAPKGIGALYVRRGTRLHSQNLGGRQERGVRGGTEAVAQIVALGAACDVAGMRLDTDGQWLGTLRNRLEQEIAERIDDIEFNGDRLQRLPNISNISFRGVEGEGLLINLDMQGIAVSTGSACSSGTLEPSPVIRALGRDDQSARTAIRFSLGRENTEADIDYLLEKLPTAVETLRKLSPMRAEATS
ncbi:MAG TPA: cysteine desulfurase family protein [Pyrinomonadaceae bacterium]|nr:cysteine desulfurase family protein [Pyrinomonadaceae bacterium]